MAISMAVDGTPIQPHLTLSYQRSSISRVNRRRKQHENRRINRAFARERNKNDKQAAPSAGAFGAGAFAAGAFGGGGEGGGGDGGGVWQ